MVNVVFQTCGLTNFNLIKISKVVSNFDKELYLTLYERAATGSLQCMTIWIIVPLQI